MLKHWDARCQAAIHCFLFLIIFHYISLTMFQAFYPMQYFLQKIILHKLCCHMKFSQLCVANSNLLFISSVVSFSLAHTHTFCNISSLPYLLPFKDGSSRFVSNIKLIFISTVVSFLLALSHTFCNTCSSPCSAAI